MCLCVKKGGASDEGVEQARLARYQKRNGVKLRQDLGKGQTWRFCEGNLTFSWAKPVHWPIPNMHWTF